MSKKQEIIVISLIVSAMCIALWLLTDRHHDTHATDKAQVVADHDTLQAHGVDYRRIVDSLSIDNYRLDSSNKSLKQGQATTRRKLNAKTDTIQWLIASIKDEYDGEGPLGHQIDSLQQQAESLTFLITQYEAYADSINNVNDSLKINYDATVKEKDNRITELQVAYDNLFKAYQQLFADSQGLKKDLKRQKLKTKIAAVLGGAAAVLGLIK